MLTLQELKRIVVIPGDGRKLPSAKQLKELGVSVVNKKLGEDTEICVYQNGYALYQVGRHSTVFPIHLCEDYFYICDGNIVHLPGQFFEKERWHLRLVLEGEDRLSHNQEERERNISYSNGSEEWAMMEDLAESALEYLVKQETVGEMLQILTERQRTVIQEYYMQEKTQMQISKELGISRLAVRDSLFHAVSKIRKMYPLASCQHDCRVKDREGK